MTGVLVSLVPDHNPGVQGDSPGWRNSSWFAGWLREMLLWEAPARLMASYGRLDHSLCRSATAGSKQTVGEEVTCMDSLVQVQPTFRIGCYTFLMKSINDVWYLIFGHKGEKTLYLQVMLLDLSHLYNSTSVTPARNVCHNLLFRPARRQSRLLVCIALYDGRWGAVLQQNEIVLLASPAPTVVFTAGEKEHKSSQQCNRQAVIISHTLTLHVRVCVRAYVRVCHP